jgi:hypothetical protein
VIGARASLKPLPAVRCRTNDSQLVGQRVPSSRSFSSRRIILPEAVIGTSVTNWIARGTLYAARCSRQ